MSSWARPGVKCVCVDNLHRTRARENPVLVVGRVYEVTKVVSITGNTVGPYRHERKGLVLAGVLNPYDVKDGAFALSRFRPLVTKTQEQDVAIFRHHLSDEPIDA